MSATTAGALKALIEAQGLGLAAFRDRAPAGQAFPYVTISEGISVTVDESGDFGDTAADTTGTEWAQVDLWQQRRHPTTNLVTESYTLPGALVRAMHGAVLTTAPTHVYGCRVLSAPRIADPDDNVVHHAVTVELRRNL